MFPLNSVLLPHTPIALRIFEPRYLVMLGRMLDEDAPEFGVVLIEQGHEAGGGDRRSGVGTMARVIQVEVGADDMHLVAVGAERVLTRAAEYRSGLWEASTELSDDPVESAWQLAGIAPLGEFDRSRLLRSTTMGALLRQTLDLTLEIEPLLTAPPVEDTDDDD